MPRRFFFFWKSWKKMIASDRASIFFAKNPRKSTDYSRLLTSILSKQRLKKNIQTGVRPVASILLKDIISWSDTPCVGVGVSWIAHTRPNQVTTFWIAITPTKKLDRSLMRYGDAVKVGVGWTLFLLSKQHLIRVGAIIGKLYVLQLTYVFSLLLPP